MAATTSHQTSILTLPGAGTPALRNIGQAWSIHNVADAIPSDLQPRHEHRANAWKPNFQAALEAISQVASREYLPEIQVLFRSAIQVRRNKRPSRVRYLTVKDLENVLRVFNNNNKNGTRAQLHRLE